MPDILKSFVELFKLIGLGNLVLLTTLTAIFFTITQKTLQFRKQRKLNSNIPDFSRADVYRATRYFVPTKFQEKHPDEEKEYSPDGKNSDGKGSSNNKLVPYFLNQFNTVTDNKYYLILADTGLGKTTFLINLYLSYKNHLKTLLEISNFYEIKLFSLGDPKALEKIQEIQNKDSVILLLDAFDEDSEAVRNYQSRLTEIVNKTQNFREVLITCRTQFFPSETEEPNLTGIHSYGEGGLRRFDKKYISTFDDADINKYLRMRFSVFALNKRIKAKKIIEKCPSLMMRPMLLYHIEDLLNATSNFNYTFQIYENLIEKWIIRESEKPGIYEKYGSCERYQDLLYHFSQCLAIDLYRNFDKRKGYFIFKDEKVDNSYLQLNEVEENTDAVSDIEAKSKSLLNRSADGRYKFSHKSILEYFLAREMIEDSNFLLDFNFESMSLTETFYNELLLQKLSDCNGNYLSKYQAGKPVIEIDISSLAKLSLHEFNRLKHLTITKMKDIELLHLAGLKHLEELVIIDELNLFPLYVLYILINEIKHGIQLNSEEIVLKKKVEKLMSPKLNERLTNINNQELEEFLKSRKCPSSLELKPILENLNKMDWFEKLTEGPFEDRMSLLKAIQFNTVSEANIEKLQILFEPVNSFLSQISLLQKKLPNCKIRF